MSLPVHDGSRRSSAPLSGRPRNAAVKWSADSLLAALLRLSDDPVKRNSGPPAPILLTDDERTLPSRHILPSAAPSLRIVVRKKFETSAGPVCDILQGMKWISPDKSIAVVRFRIATSIKAHGFKNGFRRDSYDRRNPWNINTTTREKCIRSLR